MAERKYRCPECGAGPRMIVEKHDGSLACLTCNCVFRIDCMIPKLYVKSLRPARYLGGRARAFIDLTRPLTLVAAGLAGLFLVLLGSVLIESTFSLSLAIVVGLVLASIQGGSQSFNQGIAREADLDRENKKIYRPVVQGIVTPNEAKLFALVLIGTAIGFSFALSVGFGAFTILISAFGIFYSASPVRAKYRFLISDFWQAVSRGCLPFLAVCYGLFSVGSLVPLALSVVVMLFVAGLQATKDFPDFLGDKKFGVPTLPVKLGKAGAIRVMFVMASMSFVSLGLFIWAGALPPSLSLLFVLAIPTAVVLVSVKNPKEHRLVENTLEWAGYYAILGMFYVLPPIVLL